ncbi:hypothetical protein PIB30_041491 [Stylosanthes scabra]|uniref:TF-B3 domain-containing protein n=1 Tax=Stylosanthes scabra TaxID=79078 RepID=A0ABU6TEL3_9FABA|nr:hypothetical protein [Stylosanthes scabra]
MTTLNSTQKNASHIDKELDGLVFYVEVNPALSMNESMLIVDARRNRVQVRIMKGFCSAHIVDGIESLVALYRLHSGGTMKLRFLPKQVFIVIKIRDRKMHSLPILYQNYHAMLVGPSIFKEKQPSIEEIFFGKVETLQSKTYKRPNLQTENGVKAANEEGHDESDPLLTLSLGPPSRARKLLENATEKSIRIGSPVKIPSSNNMVHGILSSARNIPVNLNLNDPPVLTLGLTQNDFTPAEVELPKPPIHPGVLVGSDNGLIVSYEYILLPSDIHATSLVLDSTFAVRAFPSQRDYVRVIYEGRRGYNMALRWTVEHRCFAVELTNGWDALVMENMLIAGCKLSFTVNKFNETTMFIRMLSS